MDEDDDCTRGRRGGLKIPAANVIFKESQFAGVFRLGEGARGKERMEVKAFTFQVLV